MRATLALTLACLLGATMAHAEEELPPFDRMWDYGKPAETEARFRTLLPKAEASGDLDYHLQLLTQIARTLGLQGKFDEAIVLLDEVEEKLTDAVPVARVRALLERGRSLISSKQAEKARPLFLEALELAKKAKADFHAVDAAHMLGIVARPEQQIAWNMEAMKIAEASKDKRTKGWLGALYNNTGWSLFELKRYEEALEVHKKGLAWREKIGQPGPTLIAKWAVARMLRALERYDEALALQQELIATRKQRGEESGFVYEELGELLLVKGQTEEAKAFFVKAWAKLKDESWIRESEPERYARLRKLAGAEE